MSKKSNPQLQSITCKDFYSQIYMIIRTAYNYAIDDRTRGSRSRTRKNKELLYSAFDILIRYMNDTDDILQTVLTDNNLGDLLNNAAWQNPNTQKIFEAFDRHDIIYKFKEENGIDKIIAGIHECLRRYFAESYLSTIYWNDNGTVTGTTSREIPVWTYNDKRCLADGTEVSQVDDSQQVTLNIKIKDGTKDLTMCAKNVPCNAIVYPLAGMLYSYNRLYNRYTEPYSNRITLFYDLI